MVATLTRIFGIEHLNLAEDVVQEALGRALQTWPYRGIPENPSAWIMRASRNLALDVIRREKVFRGKETEIARLIEAGGSSTPEAVIFSENEIADDRLRMMFVCSSSGYSSGGAGRAGVENALRVQCHRNQSCFPND